MNIKFEQSFQVNKSINSAIPGTGQIQKQKYNSIDVGHDESNFELNQRNSRTNTNISS